jgi:hypothetical protein
MRSAYVLPRQGAVVDANAFAPAPTPYAYSHAIGQPPASYRLRKNSTAPA